MDVHGSFIQATNRPCAGHWFSHQDTALRAGARSQEAYMQMEAQVVTVQPDQEKHWEEHRTGYGGAFQVGVGLPVQIGLGKKVAFEWRLQKREGASRGKRKSKT